MLSYPDKTDSILKVVRHFLLFCSLFKVPDILQRQIYIFTKKCLLHFHFWCQAHKKELSKGWVRHPSWIYPLSWWFLVSSAGLAWCRGLLAIRLISLSLPAWLLIHHLHHDNGTTVTVEDTVISVSGESPMDISNILTDHPKTAGYWLFSNKITLNI